jgi:hypothetical protein
MSASLGVLTGFLGARFYEFNNWPKLSPSDWGTWAGALGTFVAFAGTIWIATSDRRMRQRAESELARVTAAAFMIRLHHARSALLEVCQELTNTAKVGHGSLNYAQFAFYIRARCSWTTAEVSPLTILPGHAAAKLAMVQAVLAHVCLILELAAQDRRIATVQGRTELSKEATGLIGVAIEAIKVAQHNCKRYAEVAALADITYENVEPHFTPRSAEPPL